MSTFLSPVTLGFTCGIGITIGTLQIKDFLGLDIAQMPSHYIEKVQAILAALPTISWADTAVGVVTLFVLTQWHKLRLPVPGHLPAVIIGTLMALALGQFGFSIETIGTAFHYTLADGTTGMVFRMSCLNLPYLGIFQTRRGKSSIGILIAYRRSYLQLFQWQY